MAVKLFIIGRPGSGKTTAYYLISELFEHEGWSVKSIRDYDILQEMFKADTEHLKFLPTKKHKGFEIIDFSVLDIALKEVEKRVTALDKEINEIIIIEFARDEYRRAFKTFSPGFLQETYVLFVEADIETCIERIHHRAEHPIMGDDHFISDDIIRGYYGYDNWPYISSQVKVDYDIQKIVRVIENKQSFHLFAHEVEEYVKGILKIEQMPIRQSITQVSSIS